jgi:hypothetical protein
MKQIVLVAIVATALAGSAFAQTGAPPPPDGAQPGPPAGAPMGGPGRDAMPPPPGHGLPPLPPGCVTPAPAPPAPPTPALYPNHSLEKMLGISAQQAAQVEAVFQQQGEQMRRIEQQRRELDDATCRKLHAIVGDQGFAKWSRAAPPPGAGGPRHGQRR